MPGLGALVHLVAARVRRRPAGWLLSVTGIALVLGYAGGVVAVATLTADRSARTVLQAVPAADRAVRLTWQGVVTPRVRTEALALLKRLGFPRPAEVVLMNPVRLGATVVRPAAITPLAPWVTTPARTGTCTPRACPTVVASPGRTLPARLRLSAPSVHLTIAGTTGLRSATPLGFVPSASGAAATPPLLLSGDARGLDALSGLDAIYRTHSWLAPLAVSTLHASDLGPLAERLGRAQARLLAMNSGFSMAAPFAALAGARAQAGDAPHRLWLAGGGAAAALVMFVVLAAGALRRDQALELDRLRNAGARTGQLTAFVTIEAAALCGVAVLAGAVIGLLAAILLANAVGASTGAVLRHSLITPEWVMVLIVIWILGSALLAAGAVVRGGRVVDALALAAAAALAVGLAVSHGAASGDAPLAVLVAPLCALAGGVLVFRLAARTLSFAERIARRGPLRVRLALVSLARAPTAPALAAACLAVSVGLAGFALSYRSTLLRSAADEAADRVPLDGLIATGPDFTRPVDVASLSAWRTRVGGSVWPVRRTDATYVSGGASVTVPALGVPAAVLTRIHGWRATDGSAPMATLARRLVPPGPLRTPGPVIGRRMRFLRLPVNAPGVTLDLAAILRAPDGALRPVPLGATGPGQTVLRARIPAGRWDLDGLELREGAGLEATNGHQNGENVAAATQLTSAVRLGPLNLAGARIGDWRGVGAVSDVRPGRSGGAMVRFVTNDVAGLLRPIQPSDARPVPVLIGPSVPRVARLALTVDGQPVRARVVGTLRRFPTTGGGSFVVADEATLAAALDAQRPGEGASDELWQLGGHRTRPPGGLSYAWRADVEHALRTTPVAHAIVGAMLAAAGLAATLAVAGLLVALLGTVRDRRVEADLVAQGLSPRELRTELRLRIMITSAFGVVTGIAIAAALTVLTLAAVRAGVGAGQPQPPLIASAPWGELGLLAAGLLVTCGLAGVIGSATPGDSAR